MELKSIDKPMKGISPKMFNKYSCYINEDNRIQIKYYDAMGTQTVSKIIEKDNKNIWIDENFLGSKETAVPFGMNLYNKGGKKITITETVLDCLSVAEAFDGKWPVISVNDIYNKDYKKELKQYIEYINSYEEIVLWFKNEPDKMEVLKNIAELFPPGKVKVVSTNQYNSANEALVNGGKQAVTNLFWQAKELSPIGIVNANEGGSDAVWEDDDTDMIYDSPFPGIDFSKRTLTTITAGTGMGKTTAAREIVYDMLTRHNLKIGYVGLEENNKATKKGFIGIDISKPLMGKKFWKQWKEQPGSKEQFDDSYNKVIEPGNLWLFNHFGSLNSDILLDKMRYLALGAECDFILLDHISIAVSGEDNVNEVKVIDMLMTKLRSLAEETGVGIIVISHLRRPSGDKGHEDGLKLSTSHLRGSGSIAQISDVIIGIEGNQQDERTKNERTFRMLKVRSQDDETGVVGKAIYNHETGRLISANLKIEDFPEVVDDTPTKFDKNMNKFLDMSINNDRYDDLPTDKLSEKQKEELDKLF